MPRKTSLLLAIAVVLAATSSAKVTHAARALRSVDGDDTSGSSSGWGRRLEESNDDGSGSGAGLREGSQPCQLRQLHATKIKSGGPDDLVDYPGNPNGL